MWHLKIFLQGLGRGCLNNPGRAVWERGSGAGVEFCIADFGPLDSGKRKLRQEECHRFLILRKQQHSGVVFWEL